MQEVTFDLQTLTPLFLAGADTTGVYTTGAELRPPSFRGEMRYWLRTVLGGMLGTDNEGLKQVVAIEEQVFGSTERGSGVMVRLSQQSFPVQKFQRESRGLPVSGRDYLFWSMNASGRPEKGNVKPARYFISSGASFQLTLAARTGNEQAFSQSVAALWLLTHLGGIGSRSRRCAGSLQITGSFSPFSFTLPQTPAEVSAQLSAGIRQARTSFDLTARSIRNPSFDVLARSYAHIWILSDRGRPYSSVDVALRDIGARLQDYRSSIDLPKRRIFGLPLMKIDSHNRLASPLQLRLTKLLNGQYVGIAVLFKTPYRALNLNADNYGLIEQWIKDDFPEALEVEL